MTVQSLLSSAETRARAFSIGVAHFRGRVGGAGLAMKRSREEAGAADADPADADPADADPSGAPSAAPSSSPRPPPSPASSSEEGALPAPAAPPPPASVYGADVAASVTLKPERARGLRLSDVHALATWALCDHGENPRWAFVANKPLVTAVVMLLVPGVSARRAAEAAELMPRVRAALGAGLRTTHDNPTANERSAARALLCAVPRDPPNAGVARRPSRGEPGARDRRPRDPDDDDPAKTSRPSDPYPPLASTAAADLLRLEMPHPPSHYLLTPAQMVDMEYPVPEFAIESEPTDDADASSPNRPKPNPVKKPKPKLVLPPGFVATQPSGSGVANAPHLTMCAIDCEMCFVGGPTGGSLDGKNGSKTDPKASKTSAAGGSKRLALTRASVCGPDGSVVYDKLVRPDEPITDYNTAHSGITPEIMRGVRTRLEDVQRDLLRLIAAETILIGHSLENDLKRLKMAHARCVDTVALYPHPRGPPFRAKLASLVERHLGRKIQEGTHDSVADARATMELALLKFHRGPSFAEIGGGGAGGGSLATDGGARGGSRSAPRASLFQAVAEAGRASVAVDRAETLGAIAVAGERGGAVLGAAEGRRLRTVDALNDEDCVNKIVGQLEAIRSSRRSAAAAAGEGTAAPGVDDPPSFVFGHVRGYYESLEASNRRWARSTGQRFAEFPSESAEARAFAKRLDGAKEGTTDSEEAGADDAHRRHPHLEDDLRAWDAVEESVVLDAALMAADAACGRVWDALPRGAMLVVVTGVGDAPRARTLQERKWKRAQNLGPWGPWSAEADAELRATADEARCGMVYAGVKT